MTPAMIRKIAHIGIAVKDLEEHIPFYRDVLGLKFEGSKDLPERGLRVALFEVAGVRLELIQAVSPDSTIGSFIERRGEGLHHIAFDVDDAEETLARLTASGIRALDPAPRPGAGGSKVAFLHPHDTGRVLMEIYEESPARRRRK
jgi:methylmalonyl-CoA/ethylmalonyl-CoA epimerase